MIFTTNTFLKTNYETLLKTQITGKNKTTFFKKKLKLRKKKKKKGWCWVVVITVFMPQWLVFGYQLAGYHTSSSDVVGAR